MASHRRKGRAALIRLAAAFALTLAEPAQAQPADRWSAEIGEAARRFGVPEDWIRRVIQAESGGRTMLNGRPITSRAGAMGLMQLMPGTWAEMRRTHGLGPDPYDPHDNILAGTAYLRAMYDRFGYPGLYGAYNAGPTRYWEHLITGRALPAETVVYMAATAEQPAEAQQEITRPSAASSLFAILRTRGTQPDRPGPLESSGLFVELGGAVG